MTVWLIWLLILIGVAVDLFSCHLELRRNRGLGNASGLPIATLIACYLLPLLVFETPVITHSVWMDGALLATFHVTTAFIVPWVDRRARRSVVTTQIVFPAGHKTLRPSGAFKEVDDASLGGVFYDYLRTDAGDLVGVRFHLMDPVEFDAHPVYASFRTDTRFVFDSKQNFVDMVFDERHAEALQRGALRLDVVKDFGGGRVLKDEGVFGIAFSFPETGYSASA